MATYPYLIVGGGMTADAAVRGIRELDPNGTIGLFSRESDPPYKRPLLSKGLWKGDPIQKAWCGTAELGADIHLHTGIRSIDVLHKTVRDDTGREYTFGKLLLATGATPRRLPFDHAEGASEKVVYFRTMQDYQRLRELSAGGRTFAVIGGSFIGSEIAAALAMNGMKPMLIFPEEGICARLFPPELSQRLNRYYADHGVEVLPGQRVEGITETGSRVTVKLSGKGEAAVDGVVVGIGVRPATELAEAAGLTLRDGGIEVDAHLRTSAPDILAAGDVATFHSAILDTYRRVEHEDNALRMGRTAGRSMAGDDIRYIHLPYFYSDLFDLGYEAVGDMDPRLEAVMDWQEPLQKGVIYYLKAGKICGVLLWNIFGQVENARALMAEPGFFRAADLKGRLAG